MNLKLNFKYRLKIHRQTATSNFYLKTKLETLASKFKSELQLQNSAEKSHFKFEFELETLAP